MIQVYLEVQQASINVWKYLEFMEIGRVYYGVKKEHNWALARMSAHIAWGSYALTCESYAPLYTEGLDSSIRISARYVCTYV